MKKRNNKILSIALALSMSAIFAVNPFTASTYASAVSQAQSNSIDVNVDAKAQESSVTNNFTLTNKGDSLDLSKVKLRYYFTSDENANGQAFNCYYSALSDLEGKNVNITNYVHGSFVKLDNPVENADSYVEISFDAKAGTFDSAADLTLNTSINNNNWSKFNSKNDYSFNDASKTVVLVNDEVVYGTAPSSKEDTISKGALTITNPPTTLHGPTNVLDGYDPEDPSGMPMHCHSEWGKLIVPIILTDKLSEEVTSSSIILKFNKDLFDKVEIEHFITPDAVGLSSISSAKVNYELGIIKIVLNRFIYKTSTAADFAIIFSPKNNTPRQKVDLSLDENSYYETKSGDVFKPVFKYNDINLGSKDDVDNDL